MMAIADTVPPLAALTIMLRALKLPTICRHADEIARLAEREGWTFERYLHHLVELETLERRRRRLERYLKESELPRDKTLDAPARATADQGTEAAAVAVRRRIRRARR